MKYHNAVQFPYLYNDILFFIYFLKCAAWLFNSARLINNSSKTSTVQIKRIKPSIIYRLLLIGLGTPMVIYGLVRPLTIETRD